MTEIATIDWFKRWGTSVFSVGGGRGGDEFQQDRTTKLVLLSAEWCKSQYLTLSKT